MLCCALLCYAMLRYACYAALCYDMLRYALLYLRFLAKVGKKYESWDLRFLRQAAKVAKV